MASPIQFAWQRSSRWHRTAALLVLALAIGAVVFIRTQPAFEHFLINGQRPSICMLKYTTGIPCPGCRGTRAAFAFAHGRFGQSIAFNPFAFSLGIWTIGWMLTAGVAGRYPCVRLHKPWDWLWLVFFVAFILANWVYVIQAGG